MPRTPVLRTIAAGLAAVAALAVAPAPAQALDPPLPFWNDTTAGLSVSGTYTPVVGNFGNPLTPADDILWYAPGAATDYLWLSNGDTTFDKAPSPSQISGTYTPVVGDFAGNALDDIVWYAPGAAQDWLWTSTGTSFTSTPLSISGTYVPSVLRDEAGKSDIMWAAPNGGAGHVWSFEGMGTYLTHPITSPPGSRALVGMFGDGACADVFWYAPGPAADSLWLMDCSGNAGATFAQTVNGTYQPVVGDFHDESNGWDEIFWYRTGAQSTMWTPNGDGTWDPNSLTIPLAATPIAAASSWGVIHFWSPSQQDLIFWGDGPGSEARLSPLTTPELTSTAIPVVGAFVGNSADILWYQPGARAERLFHRNP